MSSRIRFVLHRSLAHVAQIMLLGDSSTGKTCLLIRFKDNTFLNNNFISTVGIDYRASSLRKMRVMQS
jgi:GTPase SAR1 family protein